MKRHEIKEVDILSYDISCIEDPNETSNLIHYVSHESWHERNIIHDIIYTRRR